MRGRVAQAGAGDAAEVALVVGEAGAEAAHREGRAHDERVAELFRGGEAVVHRVGDAGCRDIRSRVQHELLEDLAVLALVDRLEARADQLDVVLLEDAVVVQVDRRVQRGLAAERREDRVGLLLRDDRLDDLPGDRLDVGRIGEVGVGHDGRRVGVDEDDAHALLAQHAAGLGAGVVELAGLTDDDRAGADDQDTLDVVALGHYFGVLACRVRDDHVAEPVEEVVGVVRAGGGLGVVLHREGRDVEGAEALDDVVVESDVADLDAAVAGRAVELAVDRGVDREAVVVRGDLDAAGGLVEHRLVDAAVPERELVGAEAEGAAEQLVAEADAEERQPVVEHAAQQRDVAVRGGRVARAVRVEHRDGLDRPDALDRDVLRQHVHVEAARGEVVDRGLLHAEVEHGEVADPLGRRRRDLGRRDRDLGREVAARPSAARRARGGAARRPTRLAASPEKIPPRMLPAERMWRVTARVSMPLMPTTPSATRASSSEASARQFDTTREGSRTM